jgi:hypothetical protein
VPDHKIWDTLRYLRFNDLAPLMVFDPICIASLLFIHSSSCHTLRELTKLYHTPSHSLLMLYSQTTVMTRTDYFFNCHRDLADKLKSVISWGFNGVLQWSLIKIDYVNAMTISFIHLPVLKFTSSEKAMYISIFLP